MFHSLSLEHWMIWAWLYSLFISLGRPPKNPEEYRFRSTQWEFGYISNSVAHVCGRESDIHISSVRVIFSVLDDFALLILRMNAAITVSLWPFTRQLLMRPLFTTLWKIITSLRLDTTNYSDRFPLRPIFLPAFNHNFRLIFESAPSIIQKRGRILLLRRDLTLGGT